MIAELVETVSRPRFIRGSDAAEGIREACDRRGDLARFVPVGESEEGRPISGVVLGSGPNRATLVAGAHPDEPVGPQTLRLLVTEVLRAAERYAPLLENWTLRIVPHVNPDGEAANWPWIERWPDPAAYLQHVFRELPGRDVEFGYPSMRPENRAVASFLEPAAPVDLHMSLHGMSAAEGGWLLIERHWIDRTVELRRAYARALERAGLPLFDWDRKGDKGFHYIEPGFGTTPEAAAMRRHFLDAGDTRTADAFHASSMEYVRSLGGDPLCLVTEIPLFLLTRRPVASEPGRPATTLAFKEKAKEWRARAERGGPMDRIGEEAAAFGPAPLALETIVSLQLTAIELGMEAARPGSLGATAG